MTDEKLHAEYGPSSLNYRYMCPGYQPIKDESKNYLADRGTRLHEVMETGDMSGISKSDKEVIEWMWEEENKLIRENHKDRDLKVLTEETVDIISGLTFGTPDKIYVDDLDDSATIIDYKFGENPVPHPNVNLQGIAYAVGVLELFPDVETICICFIQINRPTATYYFSRSDLEESFRNLITSTIHMSERVKNDFEGHANILNPCTSCSWCDNLNRCPAIKNEIKELTKEMGGNIELPSIINPDDIDNPDDLDAAYTFSKIATNWGAAVKKLVIEKTREGTPLKTWQLTSRSGRRSIRGTGRLIRGLSILSEENDSFPELNMDELMACCSAHLVSIERYIKSRCAPAHTEEVLELFRTFLHDEGLVHKGDDIWYLRKKE